MVNTPSLYHHLAFRKRNLSYPYDLNKFRFLRRHDFTQFLTPLRHAKHLYTDHEHWRLFEMNLKTLAFGAAILGSIGLSANPALADWHGGGGGDWHGGGNNWHGGGGGNWHGGGDWHGHGYGDGGRHWHWFAGYGPAYGYYGPPPVYYAPPPVYYAPPPPVYYAPPPVYYAPPPPQVVIGVPGVTVGIAP
jgi:hypothetical protein